MNGALLGIGIDLAEAAPLRAASDAFLALVFTDAERARCARRRDPALALAGLFAAKEAAVKALGGTLAVPQIEIRGHRAVPTSRRGEKVSDSGYIVEVAIASAGPGIALAVATARRVAPAQTPT